MHHFRHKTQARIFGLNSTSTTLICKNGGTRTYKVQVYYIEGMSVSALSGWPLTDGLGQSGSLASRLFHPAPHIWKLLAMTEKMRLSVKTNSTSNPVVVNQRITSTVADRVVALTSGSGFRVGLSLKESWRKE